MKSFPMIASLRKSSNKVIPLAKAAYLAAVAAATQLAISSIPEEGSVLWSCRVGSDRRYYYHLEVRAYPDQQYRVVLASQFWTPETSKAAYTFLVDAILRRCCSVVITTRLKR